MLALLKLGWVIFYTRDGQLIDQGPGGVHGALLYGFWESYQAGKPGDIYGFKMSLNKGNKVSLKRAEHPTILQVLRSCLKDTRRAAKGDAVGSKHLPSCAFVSGVFFRQTLVWVLCTQLPLELTECILLVGFSWKKVHLHAEKRGKWRWSAHLLQKQAPDLKSNTGTGPALEASSIRVTCAVQTELLFGAENVMIKRR